MSSATPPLKARADYIKDYENLIKMRQAINQKVMMFDPKCIRNKSNWGAPTDLNLIEPYQTLSNKQLDNYKEMIEWSSPKLVQLLDNIKKLDATDMKAHGKRFKHFIFTDLKSRKYGVNVLASGLKLNGWELGYNAPYVGNKYGKIAFKTADTLQRHKFYNFYLLTSRTIFDQPINVATKRDILARFNERPDNIYGENVRIIIMDSGFKEGIDLFDIKYIHVFEPQETMADMKQVIGRGTRTCGQKGLPFDAREGWPLHVYLYDMVIDKKLEPLLDNATTAFELYMKAQKRDIRLYNFIGQIENVISKNAVDYVLTEPVHSAGEVVYHKGHLTDTEERALAFKTYEPPTKPMDVAELRSYVKREYGDFMWETPKIENGCIETPKKNDEAVKLLNFTKTQGFISNFFTPTTFTKGMLLWHSVGTGKCHARNTPILLHDGRIKMVQDIVVGDLLMGDDSTPRQVLSLATGEDEMYDIMPCNGKGDAYTVNSEHILVLHNIATGDLVEIEVNQYLTLSDSQKEVLTGLCVGVNFPLHPQDEPEINPYKYGITLIEEGHAEISFAYKCGSWATRRDVLCGILDALSGKVAMPDEMGVNIALNEAYFAPTFIVDLLFIARSLGCISYLYVRNGVQFMCIENYDNIARKFRAFSYKSTGAIKVVPKGRDQYYGFTLDGNNRYLLGDFTITHNTCTAIATASKTFEAAGYTILWVTRTTLRSDVWKNIFGHGQSCHEKIRTYLSAAGVMPQTLPEQRRLLSKSWMQPISYKQFTNLIERKNSIYQTLAKINGRLDPLRKTLLIIDEAHKLYGVSDLSTIERPNMEKLHEALMNSYAISGANSARLLVMTATPITNNPMEIVRLINLLRPLNEQLPFEFANFAERYLGKDGEFTETGKQRFCDAIAGYVSYLNLERDIRKFAQPVIHRIETPLVNPDHVREYDKRHSLELLKQTGFKIDDRIAELTMLQLLNPSAKAADIAKIRDAFKCNNKKGEEKKMCNRIVRENINALKEQLKAQADSIKTEIDNLKAEKKELPAYKKEIRNAFVEKGDISDSAYFMSPFFAFKTTCKEQGANAEILDEYITNVPQIKQLSEQAAAEEANLNQTLTEIKIIRKTLGNLQAKKENKVGVGNIRVIDEWKRTLKQKTDALAKIKEKTRKIKREYKKNAGNETRKLKEDMRGDDRALKARIKTAINLKADKATIINVPVEQVIQSPNAAKKIIKEREQLIDDIKGEIKALSKTRKKGVTNIVKELKYKNQNDLQQLHGELKNIKMGAQEIVDEFMARIQNDIATRPIICPEGKVYNPDTGRCVKVKVPKVCPEGKILNPTTGRCVKAVATARRSRKSSSRKSS